MKIPFMKIHFVYLFDFLFFNSFFHTADIAEHFDGVSENMNRRFSVIDNFNGHFRNFCAQLHGNHNNFQIESEAVNLTIGKNLFGNIVTEALDSAL